MLNADIVEILSNPNVCIGVIVSCIVLICTWLYMNQKDNEKKVKTVSKEPTEPTKESEHNDDEVNRLLLEAQSKSNIELDETDVNMIKKVDELDTKDPSSVKQYVKDIRSQSYKNKLSDTEKEREEEAKQQQLAQIYALMNSEKEKFGNTSITSLQDQMSLYG